MQLYAGFGKINVAAFFLRMRPEIFGRHPAGGTNISGKQARRYFDFDIHDREADDYVLTGF